MLHQDSLLCGSHKYDKISQIGFVTENDASGVIKKNRAWSVGYFYRCAFASQCESTEKTRRHTSQPPRPTNRSNTIPSTQDPLDPSPTQILNVQMVARPHDVEIGELRGLLSICP